MSEVQSTCPYCGVGCGVSVTQDAKSKRERPLILGSKKHPANKGLLCSKGSALAQTINTDQVRIMAPMVGDREVSWDEVSDTIASKIQSSIDQFGKQSVAFYLSGQLLTEDYYVANKLMKGYIGTANVDTNSRLCMASAVAAYKRAFGADAVPCCYDDLEIADMIILIGSNAAWTHPVLYQRMLAAKERNPDLKVVLVDPRKTVSCDIADAHLQLKPSSDGFLFQGLLHFLIENKHLNSDYIEQHTEGFAEAANAARDYDLETVAAATGLELSALNEFFELFATTDKVISFYSQGINQSATGTDKCNSIINAHLATAKIGYPGAGPFSITGQPNAMGGREVGGLATTLAAHMDFAPDDVARVQRFWNSPTIAKEPGLKAVDLFAAIHKGDIKVVWIMATNPAVSLPNSEYVRAALARCETVIVSDVVNTDTTQYADIVLPALGWGEKDGTVTNSERRISRQRSFLSGPGMAKPDWWAMKEVAKKMGFAESFDYQNPRDVFIEHASLSGFENTKTSPRCFDISGLSQLSNADYLALAPMQWPINSAKPKGTKRLFVDGQFFTESAKAQFVTSPAVLSNALVSSELGAPSYLLNTGRLRDQWHTMTRTSSASNLSLHDELPFVQMHTKDASAEGLEKGDFVRLVNDYGSAIVQVDIGDAVSQGQLFTPIHWSDQFSTQGVVNRLMPPIVDPVSGQPELKASAVEIEKFEAAHWVKIIAECSIPVQPEYVYWTTHKCDDGYITLIASEAPIDCDDLVLGTASTEDVLGEEELVSRYTNPITGVDVSAFSNSERLMAVCFCTEFPKNLPSSVWLVEAMRNSDRLGHVLRGELGEADSLVCACFGTTRNAIEEACKEPGVSQAALGQTLGCGSKCGSCLPEIRFLLAAS